LLGRPEASPQLTILTVIAVTPARVRQTCDRADRTLD
jgi:hypothetical protein